MKKILFVASVASMIDQFVKPYALEYKQLGWDVTIATNFENPGNISIEKAIELQKELKIKKIKLVQVNFERNPLNYNNLTAYKQMNKLMSIVKFDIIHSQSPVGGLVSRLVAHYNKNQKKSKSVYSAHGFHFYK
ncbi:MAG: glycosyltransferase, partial [Culicoidibacterales bacterium]